MKIFMGRKTVLAGFIVALLIAVGCFIGGIVKTNVYNGTKHKETFAAENLFSPADTKSKEVYVSAAARSSTWTKLFDFNNEGLTENNYQEISMLRNLDTVLDIVLKLL